MHLLRRPSITKIIVPFLWVKPSQLKDLVVAIVCHQIVFCDRNRYRLVISPAISIKRLSTPHRFALNQVGGHFAALSIANIFCALIRILNFNYFDIVVWYREDGHSHVQTLSSLRVDCTFPVQIVAAGSKVHGEMLITVCLKPLLTKNSAHSNQNI